MGNGKRKVLEHTKTYKNNLEKRQRFWLFHKMKDYIELCKLIEIVITLSIIYVKVVRSVKTYLFDCMKTREPWTNCQEV